MRNKPRRYLKFWRVIRYFVTRKYGITPADLDMLLFLHGEGYFKRQQFDDFDSLVGWDNGRFNRLLKEGWIEIFRPKEGNLATIYTMSSKGNAMVQTTYDYLEGKSLPVSYEGNPFKNKKKNISFTDKVYRNFIRDMNLSTPRRQRPSPE